MCLTVLEYVTEQGGSAGDVGNSFRVCNEQGGSAGNVVKQLNVNRKER